MIKIRVSFDKKEEVNEAKKVVKEITKYLSRKYVINLNNKIYWNLRDKKKKKSYGGRIYISLKKKR